MVVIGNGGSEYGVRGYISAYDAETGKGGVAGFTRCREILPRASSQSYEGGRQDVER